MMSSLVKSNTKKTKQGTDGKNKLATILTTSLNQSIIAYAMHLHLPLLPYWCHVIASSAVHCTCKTGFYG